MNGGGAFAGGPGFRGGLAGGALNGGPIFSLVGAQSNEALATDPVGAGAKFTGAGMGSVGSVLLCSVSGSGLPGTISPQSHGASLLSRVNRGPISDVNNTLPALRHERVASLHSLVSGIFYMFVHQSSLNILRHRIGWVFTPNNSVDTQCSITNYLLEPQKIHIYVPRLA